MMQHDAHAPPPGDLRVQFKSWQKASKEAFTSNVDVLDTASLDGDGRVCPHDIGTGIFASYKEMSERFTNCNQLQFGRATCYQVNALPGLFIYPSLLPVPVQVALLDKLLHRDLSDSKHTTNLHLHYDMPLERSRAVVEASTSDELPSFFALSEGTRLQPKDPTVHKTITMKQVLDKKLRWVTLGGQYDWTNKLYPDEEPPAFPSDVAQLLQSIFPETDPQAAILNLYSPGDTLSLHRDVSEECDRGLISISMGCDALFMVSNHDASQVATLRLRSGDGVLMSGEARFAWHAVPKVLAGTCPEPLRSWPARGTDSTYSSWHGWLANKRINLNVRQMRMKSAANR